MTVECDVQAFIILITNFSHSVFDAFWKRKLLYFYRKWLNNCSCHIKLSGYVHVQFMFVLCYLAIAGKVLLLITCKFVIMFAILL